MANVGDSRAVLGYVKEIYPTQTHAIERPQPLHFPSAPESAATSPEDMRSFDFNCPHPRLPQRKPVWTESKVPDPTEEYSRIGHNDDYVATAAPAPPPGMRTQQRQREFNSAVSVQLSSDHKPDVPEERNRILKSGK